jgi:hypothetical protein
LPQNWYGAGASWNGQAAGWASYAHLLSSSGQVYSYTTYDVTRTKERPYVTSSARTGAAIVLRTLGPLTILGLADAGVATASTVTSGAFSGGGLAFVRLGKTDWTICGGARVVKAAATGAGDQTVYEAGIGRVW